ncbi:unnamed protein product [Diabrotica balteata]|uniref:Uncharacterized protein n=1 Tax=Diabrotica balteata TaxID=107213 RepID=A0A9N9XBI7_DIABA|nr:unnamed protein product [Diabrotica balteata]
MCVKFASVPSPAVNAGSEMAPKRNYSKEQLAKALEDVKKRFLAATAAKNHDVPLSTLRHKRGGKSPLVCPFYNFNQRRKISPSKMDLHFTPIILYLSERHFAISSLAFGCSSENNEFYRKREIIYS